VFAGIDLWLDSGPREPASQMAVDEVLLTNGLSRPLLRHYRWLGRAASFGVSQSHAASSAHAPGFQLVRRWTGGGLVRHDSDWTFSLLIPRGEVLAGGRPRDSYAAIHSCVARALREAGIDVSPVPECGSLSGPVCFSSPVLHDLVDPAGRKICGGAQRRSRDGLLHQGSIQNVNLTLDFLPVFAAASARRIFEFNVPPRLEAAVSQLAAAKYANPAWMTRIA